MDVLDLLDIIHIANGEFPDQFPKIFFRFGFYFNCDLFDLWFIATCRIGLNLSKHRPGLDEDNSQCQANAVLYLFYGTFPEVLVKMCTHSLLFMRTTRGSEECEQQTLPLKLFTLEHGFDLLPYLLRRKPELLVEHLVWG